MVWVALPGEWQPIIAPQFAKRWPDVAQFAIYVWRSERHGGDTKAGKSRRTFALSKQCVNVLLGQWLQQADDRSSPTPKETFSYSRLALTACMGIVEACRPRVLADRAVVESGRSTLTTEEAEVPVHIGERAMDRAAR